MKKTLSVFLVLVLLFSFVSPARAESPFVEIENNVIRLRDDGSEESFSDTIVDAEVVLNAGEIEYKIKQGPIYTTIESAYICSLTVHDSQRAAALYGADADFPFTLIRLTYTVENQSEKEVRFPGTDCWIVTDMGELVTAKTGPRNGSEDVPKTLHPGERCTCCLFFSCPDTWPETISFFALILPRPWAVNGGAWGVTKGVCFELLENALC